MNENELSIVEYGEQRVVTTKQIAEVYGSNPRQVSNNFNNNKDKFQEGKHYFYLKGNDLRDFKASHKNDDLLKSTAKGVYLWTERGALLLAKSINTDVAWEAYERLVDFYFEKKDEATLPPLDIDALNTVLSMAVDKITAYTENALKSIELRLNSPQTHTCPTLSWYERNKDTIYYVAEQRGITGKKVISMVLSHVGEYYDLTKAKEIYYKQTGSKPLYDLDIIDYFSNLQKEATGYLNSLIRKKPVTYEYADIEDMF